MKFIYDDGGRSKYFKGTAGDCVTRAIAIATGIDYKEVYDTIKGLLNHTPRNGLSKRETKDIMHYFGFDWYAPKFGGSYKLHLKEEDLPMGTIICQVSKHVVCVKDKIIYDAFNPSRNGTRMVYGFWYLEDEQE